MRAFLEPELRGKVWIVRQRPSGAVAFDLNEGLLPHSDVKITWGVRTASGYDPELTRLRTVRTNVAIPPWPSVGAGSFCLLPMLKCLVALKLPCYPPNCLVRPQGGQASIFPGAKGHDTVPFDVPSTFEWFFMPKTVTCGESAMFIDFDVGTASNPRAYGKVHSCGKPLKNPRAAEYTMGVPETFDVAQQPRGRAQTNPLLRWLVKTSQAGFDSLEAAADAIARYSIDGDRVLNEALYSP